MLRNYALLVKAFLFFIFLKCCVKKLSLHLFLSFIFLTIETRQVKNSITIYFDFTQEDILLDSLIVHRSKTESTASAPPLTLTQLCTLHLRLAWGVFVPLTTRWKMQGQPWILRRRFSTMHTTSYFFKGRVCSPRTKPCSPLQRQRPWCRISLAPRKSLRRLSSSQWSGWAASPGAGKKSDLTARSLGECSSKNSKSLLGRGIYWRNWCLFALYFKCVFLSIFFSSKRRSRGIIRVPKPKVQVWVCL